MKFAWEYLHQRNPSLEPWPYRHFDWLIGEKESLEVGGGFESRCWPWPTTLPHSPARSFTGTRKRLLAFAMMQGLMARYSMPKIVQGSSLVSD